MSGRDAAVSSREQLFADLDTAAIALRLMGAEHPRLKLDAIAARVSAHARGVLEGAVQVSPSWGETSAQSVEVGGESGAGVTGPPRRCATCSPQRGETRS